MKKLSVLIALMLCVTIGGVYATWSYSFTNDITDAYEEVKVEIADAVQVGANGTYTIDSNIAIVIDQANDDHEAGLVFEAVDGQALYLTVTFTPAANAPQSIKDNAVPSELYFTTTTEMKYPMDDDGDYDENGTAVSVFTFGNLSDGVFSSNFSWTKQADGTFTYTLNQHDVESMITLTEPFVLDTKAEHDAFRGILNGNIVARVTDGTVNS